MNLRFRVSLFLTFAAVAPAVAVDVQPSDIFTATTRIDTRDWSTESIAVLNPWNFAAGEDELWVAEQRGALWHVNTVTGAKTLLVEVPSPAFKYGLGRITRVGDELVVPMDLVSGNADFSHTAIQIETGERRGFKADDPVGDLIGLPNGNLLGLGTGSVLIILNPDGETLVKTEAPVFWRARGAVTRPASGRSDNRACRSQRPEWFPARGG
jgi:hypothetical protein